MNYITDENDILFYYEVILQSEAESVLDIGGFLKRTGAISRRVRDRSFSEQVWLVAVETEDSPDIGVYHTIYNEILTSDELLSKDESYTLAVYLDNVESVEEDMNADMWKWISEHVHYLAVTDRISSFLEKKGYLRGRNKKSIIIENDTYSFITL